jgi:hypothetical protein
MSFGSRGQGSESQGIPEQISPVLLDLPVARIEMEILKLATFIRGQDAALAAILDSSVVYPVQTPRRGRIVSLVWRI